MVESAKRKRGVLTLLNMSDQVLTTHRLRLRPFVLEDATTVQQLCNDRRIAETTLHIPYPYPDGAAEAWIAGHAQAAAEGKQYTFAITLRIGHTLVGAISLRVNREFQHAEMGYWLGAQYWNQGYTTEAAAAVRDFGWRDLQLHRLYAYAMTHNPASTRVMEKIGMQYEGTLKHHVVKWGKYVDLAAYGLVRPETSVIGGSV